MTPLDIGTHMVALALWAITALPAHVSVVRLIARRTAPGLAVPAREWLGLLLGWALFASILSGFSLAWAGWLLLPVQWALGVRLAIKRGWPQRAALTTVMGGFAGFALYAFLGGQLLRIGGAVGSWGWWVLLSLVWIAWLRVPTVSVPLPADTTAPEEDTP